MKRTFALIMTALLLLTSIISCSSDVSNDVQNADVPAEATEPAVSEIQKEKTVEDILAPVKGIDLDGAVLNFNISVNGNEWNTSSVYVMGPEEETGEAIYDHVYRRNMLINDMLNTAVKWETADLNYDKVQNYVTKQVMSGDDTVDLYINDQFGLLRCMANNMLFNIYDKSYESHFDFSSEGWNDEYMTQLAIGNSRRYLLVGDYFIDALRASHVMYFNKNMYEDYFGDSDDMYKCVLDGDWNYEKLYTLIEEMYQDVNGDGKRDEGDIYGLWPNTPILFYHTTDSSSVKFDSDGIPHIDINYERNTLLEDWILKFYALDSNFASVRTAQGAPETIASFTAGRLLFTYWLKIADIETGEMRDMDGVGIIPYPKLDENQKQYYTQVHDIAEIGAIPATAALSKISAVSAYLQAMMLYSAEYLMPEYYETALKVKYVQDDNSALMLDLIRDCASSPFEMAFDGFMNNITGDPVREIVNKKTNVYTSKVESLLSGAEKKLDELVNVFIGE